MAEKPRIKLPKQAKAGEVIEIKTLIPHVMETGLRKDETGNIVPRNIINRFTCEFEGKLLFACDLGTGVAANPYLQFTAKIETGGTFKFTWADDLGTITVAEESIAIA